MSGLEIKRSASRAIFLAGFVAGALDILAAILVYSIIMEQTSPSRILQSIASGVFGKAAYSGGGTMVLAGLLLHFLIAFIFAAFYYAIFPYLSFLRKQKLISGVLFGVFVWMVMNFGVLRIVFSGFTLPDPQSALLGMSILMVAVGIPISYIVSANRP
jgi:uncharacterized membrane protein YagU involved in acid resistance